MRLFTVELKRLLKTRSVKILVGAALLLSLAMAWLPVTFERYTYKDDSGKKVTLTGLDAIAANKKAQKVIEGEVTTDKLEQARTSYQESIRLYGPIYGQDFPYHVYTENIAPFSPIMSRLKEVNADKSTGIVPEVETFTRENSENFYPQCKTHLLDLMKLEQKPYPDAWEKARVMYEKVESPFVYIPGLGSNSMEYQGLYIFLLVIICSIIAAPVFSSEYQTEADQILRCTKYGRLRLGAIKVLSCLLISTVLFSLCMGIFILITNTAFGWEGRATSLQVLFSAVTLLPLNVGGLQWLLFLLGLLSLLATVSFALFASSKCKNSTGSLAIALACCILPLLLFAMVGGYGIGDWIRCILPSTGVGLNNSFLYSLLDFKFLHAGQYSIWTPYVMGVAAAVEIPVFLGLAIRSYCSHTMK